MLMTKPVTSALEMMLWLNMVSVLSASGSLGAKLSAVVVECRSARLGSSAPRRDAQKYSRRLSRFAALSPMRG